MILNGEDPSESLDLRSRFRSLGLGWVWPVVWNHGRWFEIQQRRVYVLHLEACLPYYLE